MYYKGVCSGEIIGKIVGAWVYVCSCARTIVADMKEGEGDRIARVQ